MINSNPEKSTNMLIRIVYLKFDLVCLSSLLVQILRAGPRDKISDQCLVAARNTLDIHETCIEALSGFGKNTLMATRYLMWYEALSRFAFLTSD